MPEIHMDHLKELVQILIKLLCIVFDIQENGFTLDDDNHSSKTTPSIGKSDTIKQTARKRAKRKRSVEPNEEKEELQNKSRRHTIETSAVTPTDNMLEVTTKVGTPNLDHTEEIVGEKEEHGRLSPSGRASNAETAEDNKIIAKKLLDMLLCPTSVEQQQTALALLKSDSRLQEAFLAAKGRRGKNKIIAYKHARDTSNSAPSSVASINDHECNSFVATRV